MHVPRIKIRPDFQAGQAVNLLALLGLIWTVSSGFTNLIAIIVSERTEMKQQIVQLMADRSKYVPMIEAVVNSDAVQKTQIQSIADNMEELKENQQQFSLQITTAMSIMQNDLATIKARSENSPKTR